ncbi:hypothetical protein C4580_02860 [Candidatus Woesearchaeota archaeon]|nr:MAG: hypothetical protein C4580_02860 [Candidatus Woesearchaeota archaeon]
MGDKMTSTLAQKTVYENKSHAAVQLPLTPELQQYHENGTFALVEDPQNTKRASIVGMFVLRPAKEAWIGNPTSFSDAKHWAFNVKGADGGWLIANGNAVDAYRLALQYGVSDAVMVGSTTVAKEGVPHDGHKGYLWQPYGPANWPHLRAADPNLAAKIARQREEWQKLGYLSGRKYPAQIVITGSGEHRPGTRDILEASIFYETHPDGTPIEAYVLTSESGAQKIRERAGKYPLAGGIDKILLPLSPPGEPDKLDIARVPQFLYDSLGMRIVNHDGGQTILSEFSKAGALPQLNLTLARNRSVAQVFADYPLEHAPVRLTEEDRTRLISELDSRIQYFFTGPEGRIPAELIAAQIITDAAQDVAVVSFDARKLHGL